MTSFRISEAAELLGVSDDTARRWAESGRLPATRDEHNRWVVDGADLARFARGLAEEVPSGPTVAGSARNRFRGIVTAVRRDGVMAQVDLQAGPFRVVSLMSAEAVDELGLEVGSLAVAVVKATNVLVDVVDHPAGRR